VLPARVHDPHYPRETIPKEMYVPDLYAGMVVKA
jgi:hypothetical protein